MSTIAPYKIQHWLFSEAEGQFDIDLAESGIQHHYTKDLDLSQNYSLNYSLDCGDLKLRETIARLYEVEPTQVLITHGSQEGLYLFYRSFLKPGDHIITFKPGWQQSWEVPLHLGASVSILSLDVKDSYKLSLEAIKAAITPNTRLIILNSPHNPTGHRIEGQILQKLTNLCRDKDIHLLNDEEYLTDYKNSIVHFSPLAYSVSSLSKVYGFPGLRTGWFIGSKEIIQQMTNYRRYVSVCNSSLCEQLAIQVLQQKDKYLQRYSKLVYQGLLELRTWIQRFPNLKLVEPQGTPFAYITFPSSIKTQDFASDLLRTQKVLVMPAEVFDDHNAIRLSFGRPLDILRDGLNRLAQALENYHES